jgi:hypothetical protein
VFYTVPFDITFDMAFSLTSSELRLDATGREAEVRAGWSERALLKRSYSHSSVIAFYSWRLGSGDCRALGPGAVLSAMRVSGQTPLAQKPGSCTGSYLLISKGSYLQTHRLDCGSTVAPTRPLRSLKSYFIQTSYQPEVRAGAAVGGGAM